MKLRTRIWLVLAVSILVAGFALWKAANVPDSPEFFVGTKEIIPRMQPSLAVGHKFAAMVSPDGSLWLWGYAKDNWIDLGKHAGPVPQRWGKENDWKQVTAGFFGLIALKQDGTLWGMGTDTEGILATSTGTNLVRVMTRIGTESDWKEVRAGVGHCMGLKRDGALWAWGKNDYGQIGTGYLSPKEPMRRIGTETNWVAISAGAMQSYALRNDGTVWGSGSDVWTDGSNPWPTQLGTNQWKTMAAGEYHIVALDLSGRPWVSGPNTTQIVADASGHITNWVRLKQMSNLQEVFSGENCLIAKNSESGWQRVGQKNYRLDRVWKISTDIDPLLVHSQRGTSLLLMKDGRLWSWERRMGAYKSEPLGVQIKHRLMRMIGKRAPFPGDQYDTEPVLIWEYSGE